MEILKYYWNKFIKILPGPCIKNSTFEYPSKVCARTTVLNSTFGRYSYCGYHCTIINSQIGRFTSISDYVSIGDAQHPLEWVSTSPAFYRGRGSIPKDIAKLEYDSIPNKTNIGNDVWIGKGVYIKSGVFIGDGAVIGMGSVVTKNIPNYAIAAGNPAKIIRMRFSDEVIQDLMSIKWWNIDISELDKLANYFNNPRAFIELIRARINQ